MPWKDKMTPLYVVVDDAYVERLQDVVAGLESAGMRVEQVLDALGAVTGSADLDRLSLIADVPGVSHVSRPRQFRVPPPEADLQ
jgi:nitroreductase